VYEEDGQLSVAISIVHQMIPVAKLKIDGMYNYEPCNEQEESVNIADDNN
jgi:hypothetical protein|tara:strand:- start:256 stop:405 length:150 start_codon:yes stop_codon:yes gene_type:complete